MRHVAGVVAMGISSGRLVLARRARVRYVLMGTWCWDAWALPGGSMQCSTKVGCFSVPFGTTCTLSGTLCSAKYTGVVVSDTMDVPEVLIAAQC